MRIKIMAKQTQKITQEDDSKKSFASILQTPVSEISRPKPITQGTYRALVKGLPRFDHSTKKGTPFSEYTMQLLEAMDDVDIENLTEVLTKKNGEVIALSDRTLRLTFYHTPDALWRLAKFLKDLGLEVEDGDETTTVEDLEQQSPGRECYVHVKHTPSDDGETMYANIDKTAPVE
jgi:hypothetical protein